jgi:hypothetical protein
MISSFAVVLAAPTISIPLLMIFVWFNVFHAIIEELIFQLSNKSAVPTIPSSATELFIYFVDSCAVSIYCLTNLSNF